MTKRLAGRGVKQSHILSFHNALDQPGKKEAIKDAFVAIVGRDPQVIKAEKQYGLKSKEAKEATQAKARSIKIKIKYQNDAYLDLMLDNKTVASG